MITSQYLSYGKPSEDARQRHAPMRAWWSIGRAHGKRRARDRAVLLWLLLLACMAWPFGLHAHEIRPAIVTVVLSPNQQVRTEITVNLEAMLARIGPKHVDTDQSPQAATYNALRKLPADALRKRFAAFEAEWLQGVVLLLDETRAALKVQSVDIPPPGDLGLARISKITLTAPFPRGAATLRWSYAASFGDSILRVYSDPQKPPATAWLKDGAQSKTIPLGVAVNTKWHQTALEYVVLGFTHIVPKGLDHILFVLGLYLLSTSWRPLLIQVTAFTLAHSLTLALGLYGVVTVPPSIVEPLIAASIAYVAFENVARANLSPWRPFVVFAFGLLHGLGFAGVLQEVGLPRSEFVLGLISFNVGVELGQLAVITMAWLLTGLWFSHHPRYRQRVVVPASIVIGLVGVYWTVERISQAAGG